MTKKAYHGGAYYQAIGEDFSTLERCHDIISADTLDAWYPPSPNVLKKVEENLPFIFQSSPPTHCFGLIQTISNTRNIPMKSIAVGGGTSDLMFTFFPLMLKKESKVMILDPMYGEYLHIFQNIIGCEVVTHTLKLENSFRIDSNVLRQEIDMQRPDMIVIVNPNSPTGQYWDRTEIQELLSLMPQKTLLVIDETYIEYLGNDASLEEEVQQFSNLIVLKSMSKIFALSGARVGYMVANQAIVDKVFTHTPPWCVSHFGQIAAVEALKDWTYYAEKIEETKSLQKNLIGRLNTVSSVEVFKSVANYFLVHLKNKGATDIVKELRTQNIFVRNCDSMSNQFSDNFIRISVRNESENDKIANAFEKLLA